MSMEINITIVLFNITIVSGFYKYNYYLHVLSRGLSSGLPRGLSSGRPLPEGLQGSPLRSPAATWAAKGSACYLYRMLFIASWSLSGLPCVLSRFMHSLSSGSPKFDLNFRHGVSRFLTEKASGSNANSLRTPSVFRTFSADNPSFYSRFHSSPQPYKLLQFEKTSRSPAVQKEILSHNSK